MKGTALPVSIFTLDAFAAGEATVPEPARSVRSPGEPVSASADFPGELFGNC